MMYDPRLMLFPGEFLVHIRLPKGEYNGKPIVLNGEQVGTILSTWREADGYVMCQAKVNEKARKQIEGLRADSVSMSTVEGKPL